MTAEIYCRLCGNIAKFSFQKRILSKYDVEYFHCQTCAALQTENPYWLEEAYQPINEQLDTGQFIRCLHNAAFLDALTSQLNLSIETLIDYGCGSGLTARILRDIGINAYGYDTYSTPRLLMGFQKENLEGAAIINLCEVAEHFPNPKSSFDNIFSCNPKIVVVQTGIFNEPDVSWSYLAPEHGQHIFFYSEKTISYLAKAHCMAATFIQGYIIFIKIELLESLFIKNTNTLKVDFVSKLNQSIQNLFNKILTNGYKYAINDNLMLTKSLQIR
ncbi:methyltransferase domain-containing protein [Polynucleobacter sp. MWH-UH24A]|uniref:methyltransferase domain-containing protein n=1 Tax=Polynucleobacter sp. MWH-UH24A TaxID=2689110 RepID=UPI001BFED527|nr:methyltransferase domain-containing protein [Polynucleobacter sp. MWH-UH24A]QWD75843.1 methyltransferase domain-containing protein [Polynucleobacter sp. MWH-UH24A]